VYIGYDLNKKPIPQLYKGGLLPKTAKSGIGKIDIMKAIEVSSNPYFSLLAGDFLNSPDDLLESARLFSYGEKTGIDLPAEFSGRLPKDLLVNRNGLYATAIGQHSMVVTPLQTALMLSAIANGGKILKPKIVKYIAGETPKRSDVPFDKIVLSIPTEVSRVIQFPKEVRTTILRGMKRVVEAVHDNSLRTLSMMYKSYPEAISDFLEVKDHLVGKSGTAESMEFTDLDSEHGINMYNHVWFGGIAFDPNLVPESITFRDEFGVPEIVVIVYLRYGNWGKDVVPLAAQVANKWREIKKNAVFRESL
jgi:cell division protein FtsI/penicillin-binding protein 2